MSAHPATPEDVRNLPKSYAKKSKNENKNKRKLTDTPVKNALTPSTRERSEHQREELCLKNMKEKRATYLKRDLQKQKQKFKKKS